MRSIFDATTRLALRFRWITLLLTLLLIVLGAYSYTQLNQELIPKIEFPQTFILSQNSGASSDQMLHMYSSPLEARNNEVDGVVNIESTSSKGFSFLIVRNEFGLNQTRVTGDVRAAAESLPLPVRTLVPADGTSPREMIGELSPEAVLWLYNYAEAEDIGFAQQLSSDVWNSFSAEVLGVFPEEVYGSLETNLRESLLAKRVVTDIEAPAAPPALPDSWIEARDDVDRFETALDLVELTDNRTLASVFNSLLEDGEVVGALGTASDLTARDVEILMDVQERCQTFRTLGTSEEDPCSFIKELTADVVLALDPEASAALPADYTNQLSFGERSVIARNYLAGELTGEGVAVDDAPLPDPWRADAPILLTFNFSDLPLGFITVGSDQLSEDELETFVEDVLVPQLKDLEDVADVTVFGGGQITFAEDTVVADDSDTEATPPPADDSEAAADDSPSLPDEWITTFGMIGADLQTTADLFDYVAQDERVENVTGLFNAFVNSPGAGDLYALVTPEMLQYIESREAGFLDNLSEDVVAALDPEVAAEVGLTTQDNQEDEEVVTDSPTLPDEWITTFGMIGAELETVDDLFDYVAQDERVEDVTGLFNAFVNSPGAGDLYALVTPEMLQYIESREAGFLDSLSEDVIAALDPEVADEVGLGAPSEPAVEAVALGDYWAELSSVLGDKPLATTADLIAFEGDAAATINQMVSSLEAAGYGEYAVLLINDLTPEAIEALATADEDFLNKLEPAIFTLFSREVLESEPVASFVDEELSGEVQATATAIRDGDQPTAMDSVDVGASEVELLDDPDAPALPSGWGPVGNFIGLPLEQADDVINARTLPQYASGADFVNQLAIDPRGQERVRELPAEVWVYLGENEPTFWNEISAVSLRLIPEDVVGGLPQNIQNRLAEGDSTFIMPSAPITRTNQKSSLVLALFKTDEANTVEAWHAAEDVINDVVPDDVEYNVVFEQASYIEDSITGVRNEGTTGAIMAIIVILLFMNLSLRSTLVTSVSIPASVMAALFLMRYVPGNVYDLLAPVLDDVGRDSTLGSILQVVLRLFPEEYTLNIMTLSGLTVAIGRVVDDSIVVLENIYRNIMQGEEKRSAILNGTREVSVAIFAATLTTMVVFLPLGLFGGVVGAFFLPFGLAVTYALAASYLVAITTIPALSSIFIDKDAMPEEEVVPVTASMGAGERIITQLRNWLIARIDSLTNTYVSTIKWALRNRVVVIVLAGLSLAFGIFLLSTLPQTFLPQFGDPTITVAINLPAQTEDGRAITLLDTEERVAQIEAYLAEQEGVEQIQTSLGGSLNTFDPSADPNDVVETVATIQVGMESQAAIDAMLDDLRDFSETVVNDLDGDGEPDENADYVTVSGVQEQGDFGGFSLVVSGPDDITLSDLIAYNDAVLAELETLDGLVNIESSLGGALGGNGEETYIRIDGIPAIRYSAELETSDTLGVTNEALIEVQDAIDAYHEENPDLAANVEVSKGFESEQQEEGFRQIFISMMLATVIVYLLLALTFGNLVHPVTILVSLPLAVVGAAVALTVTGRVLGLSAMIGLLMLIGIVVTNAVVLLDRVQQNKREKNMNTYDALVEAGAVRLRPILMTAISTMMGVLPLALGFTEGAIIAAELGTVVIGGLVSSTFLTLLVVPVVYSLFDSLQKWLLGLFGGGGEPQTT